MSVTRPDPPPPSVDLSDHDCVIEVHVKEQAIAKLVPMLAPYGPVTISSSRSSEVAYLRPKEADLASSPPPLLRFDYEQINAWYGRIGVGAPLPERWVALPEAERRELKGQHLFAAQYNIPAPVDFTRFPTPVIWNPKFPQVTAVGEVEIPVQITEYERESGVWVDVVPARGFSHRTRCNTPEDA